VKSYWNVAPRPKWKKPVHLEKLVQLLWRIEEVHAWTDWRHNAPMRFPKIDRGLLLAAAGIAFGRVLDHFDAPLWMFALTLVVLLFAAFLWDWISSHRYATISFYAFVPIYLGFLIVAYFWLPGLPGVLSGKPLTPQEVTRSLPAPVILSERPDIGMEFVNPLDVAFRMVNLSNVLRDPKYGFDLMDIDRSSTESGTTTPYILPIPAFADAGDFLRPKTNFLQRPIVSTFPQVREAVKPGDRIFGYVTVSCPNCVKDRRYWVFFVNGSGGWYSETPTKDPFELPVLAASGDVEGQLEKLVPPAKRIAIGPLG
jgi:hypothetical protein